MCGNIFYLMDYLLQVLLRNIINAVQRSFRANKSCQTNLLQTPLKKPIITEAELLLRLLAHVNEALTYEHIILMYLITKTLTKRLML